MNRHALRAVDLRLARRGRLIDEPGAGGGAAHAILLVELQVGEFEDEFLQRLGLGLRSGGNVRRKPLAHRDEDRVHRRLDAARVAAHGDVDRLLAEELLQHAELGAVERERDDRELVLAALSPARSSAWRSSLPTHFDCSASGLTTTA